MKITLKGCVTGKEEVVTPEEAIDVLQDCEIEYRLSEKTIREKWARGESAESDMFTATPIMETMNDEMQAALQRQNDRGTGGD